MYMVAVAPLTHQIRCHYWLDPVSKWNTISAICAPSIRRCARMVYELRAINKLFIYIYIFYIQNVNSSSLVLLIHSHVFAVPVCTSLSHMKCDTIAIGKSHDVDINIKHTLSYYTSREMRAYEYMDCVHVDKNDRIYLIFLSILWRTSEQAMTQTAYTQSRESSAFIRTHLASVWITFYIYVFRWIHVHARQNARCAMNIELTKDKWPCSTFFFLSAHSIAVSVISENIFHRSEST